MEIRTLCLFTLIDIRFCNKINISSNYFFLQKTTDLIIYMGCESLMAYNERVNVSDNPGDIWCMNNNVSAKQLKDLRNEFAKYLLNKNPHWSDSTVNTVYSDAFFALNNPVGIDFWSIFASEELLMLARDKIENFLTRNNRSGNLYLRANGYMSALRHIKAFPGAFKKYLYVCQHKINGNA